MKLDKANQLLQSVLEQVPFDGWSEKAFEAALKESGMGRGEADCLFPSGLRDVIELFLANADRAMEAKVAKTPAFKRLKVRDKIKIAIEARLVALAPNREAFRRLLYWYAMPLHAPFAVKRMFTTVDLIWRLAGDQSTDFNYYTKRGLLALVIKTTVLFWLDDESDGFSATFEFLDRRISDVLKFGKTMSLIKEWKPSEIFGFMQKKILET